jgi:FlaA1/EpsC-like NDP-sugar epimerase
MHARPLLAFSHDLVAALLAWCVAFWFRFNLDIPQYYQQVMLSRLPLVVAVHAVVFWRLGLYRGLWRYASLSDLQRILAAVGIAALSVPALLAVLRIGTEVPRSVYLIAPILLVGGMSGSRLLYRAWKERRVIGLVRHPEAVPVVVLGAGAAAAALLKDLSNSDAWRALALLDDDPRKRGGEIVGVKIAGPVDQVGEVAKRHGVTQAIIAMPGASHGARKRAVDLCTAAGLSVMTVPALSDIVSGKVSVSSLRHVQLDDLLGRDPVQLDQPGLKAFIAGKTVLVTGAGGSIGAELCRQIAHFSPGRLVLFDISEFALYSVELEFREQWPELALVAAIGDAKDPMRVREVFERWTPQVVFHAAAYKHVPLMETENAFQAVCNNVLGTIEVVRAAHEAAAEKFVLVSTDKAVNPTNVMGASKRLAELACERLQSEVRTPLVIVRFGNVLGSAGSVVPRFREQIARGGPVTVTHPDIRRYFMSIPEAAQLVLQAALMGRAGEIYVLDMGEPVKVLDLAREMIRLSGFSENDIPIVFTGLRPGEKLYEELLADSESTLPTPHPKLRIARTRGLENGRLVEEVEDWVRSARAVSQEAVREALGAWVPEYRPELRVPQESNAPVTPQ